MAEDLRELESKLESARSLHDIVQAMRDMSAIYVRRAESALRAIRPYAEVVERALGMVLDLTQASRPRVPADSDAVVVVFAGEQGLAGNYNDRVVRQAEKLRDMLAGAVQFIAIGYRGRELMGLRGLEPILTEHNPGNLESIRARVPELAARVFNAYRQSGARQLYFVYSTYESLGKSEEHFRRIVPPAESIASQEHRRRYGPMLTAEPAEVLGNLVEEYFFIEFHRALLEAHASENGARLSSMTSAATNIEDRLEGLNKRYQGERKRVITDELLEVVGGAEAQAQAEQEADV